MDSEREKNMAVYTSSQYFCDDLPTFYDGIIHNFFSLNAYPYIWCGVQHTQKEQAIKGTFTMSETELESQCAVHIKP